MNCEEKEITADRFIVPRRNGAQLKMILLRTFLAWELNFAIIKRTPVSFCNSPISSFSRKKIQGLSKNTEEHNDKFLALYG